MSGDYCHARLIFLDFDGVLHPGLSGTFVFKDLFEEFMRQHTVVRVVFSTTWRTDESLEGLRAYFSHDLRDRFIGVTPVLNELMPAVRQHEISAWLSSYRAHKCYWAALDDSPELFLPSCPQLVVCDTAKGIRQKQLLQLEQVLQLGPYVLAAGTHPHPF